MSVGKLVCASGGEGEFVCYGALGIFPRGGDFARCQRSRAEISVRERGARQLPAFRMCVCVARAARSIIAVCRPA